MQPLSSLPWDAEHELMTGIETKRKRVEDVLRRRLVELHEQWGIRSGTDGSESGRMKNIMRNLVVRLEGWTERAGARAMTPKFVRL